MNTITLKVIIADDDVGDRKNIERLLAKSPWKSEFVQANSMDDVLALDNLDTYDIAFIDFNMPGHNVLDGIKQLSEKYPYLGIIMVTGQGDELIAADAFKAGIADYLPKKLIGNDYFIHGISRVMDGLQMKRKLDSQYNALQSYAYILAHDLKAPAKQIEGFVELIEEDLSDKNYDDLEVYVNYIKSLSKRMIELVDTLSAYNELDTQMEWEEIDVQQLLNETLVVLNESIELNKTNIKITGDLPTVLSNPSQLGQVFQNLISNAIKYNTESNPEVAIGVEDIEGFWRFSIADNGIGIPPESLATIFDMFKRAGNHENVDGSGIGLATCKKVINHLGGKIWCESEVNKGSTFYFTIPKS